MKSRYLTENELLKLAVIMGDKWLPHAVSIDTGLRVGDVVRLKWSQIDADGNITYTAEKTGKSGTATLSQSCMLALLRYREHVEKSEYVFPGRKPGTHITRQAIWQRIKAAATDAGIDIDGCSPHSTRKVYAVNVTHERGIRAAQEALQHKYIGETEIYALADWTTGENAKLPLVRGDMRRLVDEIIQLLGLDNSVEK